MKRFWMLSVIVGVMALFGVVGAVYAQGTNPPATPAPGDGVYGPGMMNGRGGMMSGAARAGTGAMHEYMVAELAEKLGLTLEAYQEQFDQGKTFWQIAEDQGLSVEEAQQIMTDARRLALDQMVQDGVITQEQAEWMKTRMSGSQAGTSGCMGSGRMGGGRMGGRW